MSEMFDVALAHAKAGTENNVGARFMALFAGLTRAYGQTRILKGTRANEQGKIEAVCSTVHDELDVRCWVTHPSPVTSALGYSRYVTTARSGSPR